MIKLAVYEALGRIRHRGRNEDLELVSEKSLHTMTKGTADADNPERQAYDHELKMVLEYAIDALRRFIVRFLCCERSKVSALPKPPRAWMLAPRRSRPDCTGHELSCARKSTGARVSWRQRFFHFTYRDAIE